MVRRSGGRVLEVEGPSDSHPRTEGREALAHQACVAASRALHERCRALDGSATAMIQRAPARGETRPRGTLPWDVLQRLLSCRRAWESVPRCIRNRPLSPRRRCPCIITWLRFLNPTRVSQTTLHHTTVSSPPVDCIALGRGHPKLSSEETVDSFHDL